MGPASRPRDGPDYILIDIDAKRMCDLLRDPRTAETRITALHLYNRRDELFRWSRWTRPTPMSG
jgi:hypothetical protein